MAAAIKLDRQPSAAELEEIQRCIKQAHTETRVVLLQIRFQQALQGKITPLNTLLEQLQPLSASQTNFRIVREVIQPTESRTVTNTPAAKSPPTDAISSTTAADTPGDIKPHQEITPTDKYWLKQVTPQEAHKLWLASQVASEKASKEIGSPQKIAPRVASKIISTPSIMAADPL